MRLLFRAFLRYLLRHPWQIALSVLGVALGVAVVVSIDLANASASRAFALSTERITGQATHQIIGGPNGLDEDLYRRIRVDLGIRPSEPIVEGYVNAISLDGLTMQVLGVDPFAEAPFRSYLSASTGANADLSAFLTEPGAVVLSAQTAQRYGLQPGDPLVLQVGTQQHTVRIVSVIRPDDNLSARALESLLIADIATAQELLDSLGRLSRIDLIIDAESVGDPNQIDARLAAVESILPPGAELVRPETRANAFEQMTSAFELNLTALSLLALIVGMFLIYNTMTFSIVQRRSLIGTLRCIGVTRRQIFGLVLSEAIVISLIGSIIGLGMGVVLGHGLVGLVTQTINDLYFVVTVRGLMIDPLVLLKGMLLGIGATLIAASVPALEATLTPPRTTLNRSSIEDRIRRTVPRATLIGAALVGGGGGLLALPDTNDGGSLFLAFIALLAIVVGCALLTPAVTVALMALARPLLGRLLGLLGRMAARDVTAALSRTSVAIAALMVAVSVTIGVGIMVGSFRQTVINWLNQSLVADIYISPPSSTATRVDTTIDRALVDELANTDGVIRPTLFRNILVDTPAGLITMLAIKGDIEQGKQALRFRQGGDEAAWNAFQQGALFISEPMAYRTGLGVGDTLQLRTDKGLHDFPIAGVYYNYTSDRGVLRIDYDVYRQWWDDPAISSLALSVAPDVDVDAVIQELRARVAGRAELTINSNQALRANTLEVFDRTFAITAVLQMLATIVSFIGILSALMAMQLERTRELGMLRANGLTPRQLWGVVLSQTGLMGLTAGIIAIPVGFILALVLIYVINRRSFGWTLDLSLDPMLFIQALLVAIIAALLAGIYPAFKMSRTSPALALREE